MLLSVGYLSIIHPTPLKCHKPINDSYSNGISGLCVFIFYTRSTSEAVDVNSKVKPVAFEEHSEPARRFPNALTGFKRSVLRMRSNLTAILGTVGFMICMFTLLFASFYIWLFSYLPGDICYDVS